MIRHGIVRCDGLGLRELGQLGFPADVLDRGGGDDEVGGEHRCGDFAAVGTVAYEGVDQIGLRCWLVVRFSWLVKGFMR